MLQRAQRSEAAVSAQFRLERTHRAARGDDNEPLNFKVA